MHQSSSNPSKRSVWLMAIVIILGVYQILFAYRVLIDNRVDANLLTLSPLMQGMIAFSWAIICCMVAWQIWCKHSRAKIYTAGLLIAFTISRLIQNFLFVQADYNRNRFSFLIVITLMILTVLIALMTQRRQDSTHK